MSHFALQPHQMSHFALQPHQMSHFALQPHQMQHFALQPHQMQVVPAAVPPQVQDNMRLQENSLDDKTVLILFLGLVIVFIYLVALLLIVVRRAKKLIELHNRRYYFIIAFYIITKIIVCIVLGIEIIVGITSNWVNLSATQIEAMVKTAIVLADLCVIELFLISLEYYFKLSLSALHDTLTKKQSKYIGVVLQAMQIVTAMSLLILLVIFDINELGYGVLNGIGLGLNLLVVISFLITFFYLNFKMTGIMMQPRMNEVIKRVYKLQLIILVSRAFMITFELLTALFVQDSFEQAIESIGIQYEIVLGLVFIGSVLFILFTEGLPVMYSLRGNVVQSLNFKAPRGEHKENLEQSLAEQLGEDKAESRQMRLKSFTQLADVRPDKDQAIWISKKGSFEGKDYLIRISKHEISNYIFEDIDNEITLCNELALKPLSRLSYFCEAEIIHLVQKFYSTNLDSRVEKVLSEAERLKVAIQLAEAIEELHKNQMVHGCLSPSHIFYQNGQVILNGCGLHSMRKYLSLITGYTNKSMYTAVQHLKDKNNVILKPQKAADVYSFGVLLYEIITKNRQYRQLALREVQLKFAEENFRPKLPEHIKLELKNLIRRCWHENAESRPEIQEVVDILRRFV